MANGKISFGKQSSGRLALDIPDDVNNTEVIVPVERTLAKEKYIDSKIIGANKVEA